MNSVQLYVVVIFGAKATFNFVRRRCVLCVTLSAFQAHMHEQSEWHKYRFDNSFCYHVQLVNLMYIMIHWNILCLLFTFIQGIIVCQHLFVFLYLILFTYFRTNMLQLSLYLAYIIAQKCQIHNMPYDKTITEIECNLNCCFYYILSRMTMRLTLNSFSKSQLSSRSVVRVLNRSKNKSTTELSKQQQQLDNQNEVHGNEVQCKSPDYRENEMQIQMLSKSLYEQLFNNVGKSVEKDKIRR